jgi:hypothetical protein
LMGPERAEMPLFLPLGTPHKLRCGGMAFLP